MINSESKIVLLTEKKLVGQNLEMSLANNTTRELFSGFMPDKKLIKNTINEDIFEVIEYGASHFKKFSPRNTFTKWAMVEVSSFEAIPENMQTLTLIKGLYAVFHYKGLAKDFGVMMQYIYDQWLPNSEYLIDTRPHFNILGDKYKNNHSDSEEEVYIPIKEKTN